MKTKRLVGVVLAVAMLVPAWLVGVGVAPMEASAATVAQPAIPTVQETGAVGFVDKTYAAIEPTADGDGDGYIDIATAEEFNWFMNQARTQTGSADAKYELVNSVNMSGKNYGTGSKLAGDFAGVLEGNSHAIFNLMFTGTTTNTGVFATVSGTIQNVDFVNTSLTAGSGWLYGLITSLAGGQLLNVRHLGMYVKGAGCAGLALASSADARIENCVVSGEFINGTSGGATMAGLVADAVNTTITGCESYVNMTASKNSNEGAGGIVGKSNLRSNDAYLTITDTKNYGSIVSLSGLCGGIIGTFQYFTHGTFTIERCANYGNLSTQGTERHGGKTGSLGGILGDIINGGGDVDGGQNLSYCFVDCSNYGNLTGSGDTMAYHIGGIVGYNRHATQLENCFNYGDISYTGTNTAIAVGGLIGMTDIGSQVGYSARNSGVIATNCGNFGTVSGTVAGGIAGIVQAGKGIVSTYFPTPVKGIYLNNVVVANSAIGTTGGAAVAGIVHAFKGASDNYYQTPEFVFNNCAINGAILHTMPQDATSKVTVGDHVYIDTAIDCLPITYTDAKGGAFDIATVAGNYATMMADQTARYGFTDALNEAVGTHTPWYTNAENAIHPISELTIDGATVDITHGGAIRMALKADGVSYLTQGTVHIAKGDVASSVPILQNGSAIFVIDAGRIMDAANADTYSIASGDKTYGSRNISLIEVLAGIYGASNVEEQALIAALVNYVEYTQIAKGQTATAIDLFNGIAGAGTVAKADLAGITLEMNGPHKLAEGYTVALSLDNGFVITASNGDMTVNQKVLFTDMDKEVWIGENAVGGKTTVNNMLYIYMTSDSFSEDIHNQAKALVLYQEALAALSNPNS